MRTITLCFHKANRSYAAIFVWPASNVENKKMPSEKRVSDGICAPCVRLHFVFTKLIVATPLFLCGLHRMWKIKRCRLKKGFRRHLCAMRTITLCFRKANRTYASVVCMPCFCGVIVGMHTRGRIKCRCRLKAFRRPLFQSQGPARRRAGCVVWRAGARRAGGRFGTHHHGRGRLKTYHRFQTA